MKTEIIVKLDVEKYNALEYALRKENTSVQRKMNESLRELYEKTVPEAVREYIDSTRPRPRKTTMQEGEGHEE